MRKCLRVIAFLLAIPLAMGGVAGVVLARGGDGLAAGLRARAKIETSEHGAQSVDEALSAGLAGARILRLPVLHFGMLGAALVLAAWALAPAFRGRKRSHPCPSVPIRG